MNRTDPLKLLPGEVILQVCLHSDIKSLLRLEAVSKSWNIFLQVHSEHIWSHKSVQQEILTAGDEFARPSPALSRPMTAGGSALTQQQQLHNITRGKWSCDKDGWTGVDTWKEYCRREYLLHSNLNSPDAEMYDRNINTHDVIVWRMRPDYENRLLVCTAHNGGLWVYDIDTGDLLWNLPKEDVSPHAHLEHSQGTLAFNPGEGETIEIWRLAELVHPGRASNQRGEYVQVGRLPHDRELRGWHLLYPELCVVSNQGQAWVYDVASDPPQLKTTITIDNGARGHLDQDETSVMFCMKKKGYHVYDKSSGQKLGEIDPASWSLYGGGAGGETASQNILHVVHPEPAPSALLGACQLQDAAIPTSGANVAADLRQGPLNENIPRLLQRPIEEEEWGAGMVSGPYMVGVSRGGRVLIISDWKAVLDDPSKAKDYAAIVECQADSGSHYDLGGWLSLGGAHGNQRAAWEVRDRVYLFPLPAPRTLPRATQQSWDGDGLHSSSPLPIHAIPATSDSQLPVPISFMQLTEDHLLTTFASIKLKSPRERNEDDEDEDGLPPPRLYMSKSPRFVNFAPWINAKVKLQVDAEAAETLNQTRSMMQGGFLAASGDLYDSEDDDQDGVEGDDVGLFGLPAEDEDEDMQVEVQDGELVLTALGDAEDLQEDVEDDDDAAA